MALLESWWDAGTRGDLAGDATLVAAAEAKAQQKVERPRVSLQGPAEAVFAVSTPTGAVVYVVQYATDTRGGETTIAQGVSLPVGVALWYDAGGRLDRAEVDPPVSQAESATSPTDSALTVGMWTNHRQRTFVAFDTGYPTHYRPGVLGPKYSSPHNLVRIADRKPVTFGADGYVLITPSDRTLSGTARIDIRQPAGVANVPALQGDAYDWARNFAELTGLDLGFESLGTGSPRRIRPYPAAYSARQATQHSHRWTRQRVSFKTYLWGTVPQAQLPGGERVLLENVVYGKAYISLIRLPGGKVAGQRCKTPGPVLTASCRLPHKLGRLFAADEPFAWRKGDGAWHQAKLVTYETFAAITRPGSTIKVTPKHADPFVLYR